MIRLVPMSQRTYLAWIGPAIRNFADERIRAGNTLAHEAPGYAEQAFQRLLPQGLDTPGQWLFSIVRQEGEAEEQVGVLWLGSPPPDAGIPRSQGLVYDLLIHPAYRRRGYARQAMLLLEREARDRGMDALVLHVFGHNRAARALYEELGYEVTNLNMRKSLAG